MRLEQDSWVMLDDHIPYHAHMYKLVAAGDATSVSEDSAACLLPSLSNSH